MQIRTWIFIGGMLIGIQAIVLYVMGQPLISASGMVKLWHGVVLSSENSQQISDWYTFSHVLHGFLFFAALSFLFPRMSVWFRLAIAVGVEVSWELFENTDTIINRYREQALAQGYVGDSVINSVCDTIAMVIGFVFAWRVPVWVSVVALVAIEALMLYFIRDSLTLNITQLLHPVDWVSDWQGGRI